MIYYINLDCRKTYNQNLLKCLYEVVHILSLTIGGPIQCVVSYRDQCAREHTS